MPRSLPAILALAGVLGLGAALVAASLIAHHDQWDRETEISAARHDGGKLLGELGSFPGADPLDYLETRHGPARNSLGARGQGWVTWEQSWATDASFAEVAEWHRERLGAMGWAPEASDPNDDADFARFTRGHWSICLRPLPAAGPDAGQRFQRRMEWHRKPAAAADIP